MKKLNIFKMEDFLERNRFSSLFNLGESGFIPQTVAGLLTGSGFNEASASASLLNLSLHDSPNWGREDLRKIIASWHGPETTSDNILITTGTSEALFLLLRALQPKKVAVVLPGFQLLTEIPNALGAEIVPLPIDWNDKGQPFVDEDEWKNILYKYRPDCLIINNPHNPSGLVFRAKTIELIKNYCKQEKANLIADEHYRFLMKSKSENLGPTLYENHTGFFATGSFIKCFGCPGLRIGWCVGDRETLVEMQSEKNYTTHTVNPISEWIAYTVLKGLNTNSLYPEIKQTWSDNKKILSRYLSRSFYVKGVAPEGGLVSCIAPRFFVDEYLFSKLTEELLSEGVFLLPLNTMTHDPLLHFGKKYTSEQRNNLHNGYGYRIGLGIETHNLKNACERMEKVFEDFQKRTRIK